MKGGNSFVECPHAFVVVRGQHPPTPECVAGFGTSSTIQAATKDRCLFEDRDVFSRQLAIADHEYSSGQRTNATTDEIGPVMNRGIFGG